MINKHIVFGLILPSLLLLPMTIMGRSADEGDDPDDNLLVEEAAYNAGFLSSVIKNTVDVHPLNTELELGYTIGSYALNADDTTSKTFALMFNYCTHQIATSDSNLDNFGTDIEDWPKFMDGIPSDLIQKNYQGKHDGARYMNDLTTKDIKVSTDIFASLIRNQTYSGVATGAFLSFDLLSGEIAIKQTRFNSFTAGMMTAMIDYGIKNNLWELFEVDDYHSVKFNNTIFVDNPFDSISPMLEYDSDNEDYLPENDKGISRDIFRDDFTFESIGIGGVDDIYRDQFRTALISRILTPEQAGIYDLTNVKGMILHGPPGTGKTLISRKISYILSDKEPKIVRGPEVYGSYVGQTENNIREIFEDAINDQYLYGKDSPIHVIVIDEIDSFCGKRSSSHGNPVHNSAINQFLTMIDGFHEINNIFLIGTTNRIDLLDDAILRPGRFELHVKVGIPDFEGRKQIFRIHTKHIRDNNLTTMTDDDIAMFARLATYYTGADIAASVKRGISNSLLSVVLNDPDTNFNGTMITANDITLGIKEVKDTSENQIIKAHKLLDRTKCNLKKNKVSRKKLDIYVNDLKRKVKKINKNKIILANNLNRLDTNDKQHYVTLEYMLHGDANIRIITDRDIFGLDSQKVKALIMENIYKCEDADNSIIYIPNMENILRLREINDRIMYDDYMYDFMRQLLNLTYDSKITIILGFTTTSGQSLFEGSYDWFY
jgi:ATP-dependent 26S proteasome regulatory subunit